MNKQRTDLVEFLVSILAIAVIAILGAIIGGPAGMMWFSLASFVVGFVLLYQRQSFYKWIHAFLFTLIALDHFVGLGSLVK